MDRWEKTVTAPIRLDMFAEIPLMILCLIFGVWQIARAERGKHCSSSTKKDAIAGEKFRLRSKPLNERHRPLPAIEVDEQR